MARPPDDAGATTPTQTVGQPPDPGAAQRRSVHIARVPWQWFKRAWPVLRWFAGLALFAVAVDVLAGHRGELTGIGTVLAHLRWWWVLPALLAEAASELSFVAVQDRLLRAGGVRARVRPLAAMTFASQALTNSVPAGSAVAAVYGFRWYRRLGADDALAGWALVGTVVSAALSLALLATIGLVSATEEGATLDLIPAVLGWLAVTVVLGVLFLYERPLAWLVRWLLRTSHRLIGRPRTDHEQHMERIVARVTVVRIGKGQAIGIVGWAFANWLFDCTCFGIAFLAIGSSVPWKGLLLAYGAGQLAANLPITPGGLGTVEGSITIALAYFGGVTSSDIGAVLVYRLISFWLMLLVGWACWGGLAWGVRRGRWRRSVRDAPVDPHVTEIEDRADADVAADGGNRRSDTEGG